MLFGEHLCAGVSVLRLLIFGLFVALKALHTSILLQWVWINLYFTEVNKLLRARIILVLMWTSFIRHVAFGTIRASIVPLIIIMIDILEFIILYGIIAFFIVLNNWLKSIFDKFSITMTTIT